MTTLTMQSPAPYHDPRDHLIESQEVGDIVGVLITDLELCQELTDIAGQEM